MKKQRRDYFRPESSDVAVSIVSFLHLGKKRIIITRLWWGGGGAEVDGSGLAVRSGQAPQLHSLGLSVEDMNDSTFDAFILEESYGVMSRRAAVHVHWKPQLLRSAYVGRRISQVQIGGDYSLVPRRRRRLYRPRECRSVPACP